MKSVKRILLFIFILIGGSLFSAYAGNRGEIKGMLITVSYDTLNGFIKKVPDKKLFVSLKFRTSLENEYRDYRPEQIEAFISDKISLFSHRICLNNVNRYIFIKKIYDGKIDLYYSWLAFNSDLIINGNDLYFAGFEDGKIIHLQKQFMIKTLTAIFWDSDCVLQEIETDRFDFYYYKYNKLFHLFETYDLCSGPSLAMKTRSKKTRDLNPEL